MKALISDLYTGENYFVTCADDCKCSTARNAYETAVRAVKDNPDGNGRWVQMGCINCEILN